MKRDHGPPVEGAASFHTTRWMIVMKAAQSQAQGGSPALAELCRLYWYPLYIFGRRRGHSPDDAQDLTQGFFMHLVEHRALTGIDPLRGKFRSFLPASSRITSRIRLTASVVLKEEETKNSCTWMHERPKNVRRGDPCPLRGSDRIRRAVRLMKTESGRVCSICGNQFAGAMEFCPVCMLRKALAGDVQSGESSFEVYRQARTETGNATI